MRARAPGKLVVSGAYSVLEGAPAIVVSVDRYAVADTSLPAERVTEEVRAAIEAHFMKKAAWFDASELRARLADGRDVKLGLGSSAAILVASMAAQWAIEDRTLDPRAMFQAALSAHRTAQGGGSGVDVAASVFGGALVCRLARDPRPSSPYTGPPSQPPPASSPNGPRSSRRDVGLAVSPHDLPPGTVIEAFASPVSASTPDLVGRVRAFADDVPDEYARMIGEAAAAASTAVYASTPSEIVAQLRIQARALSALGDAAGAPIFTPDVTALARIAEEEGAIFYPSGAGGGDVALFVGAAAPSDRFREEAEAAGRFHLALRTGVPGVHLVSTGTPSGAVPVAL